MLTYDVSKLVKVVFAAVAIVAVAPVAVVVVVVAVVVVVESADGGKETAVISLAALQEYVDMMCYFPRFSRLHEAADGTYCFRLCAVHQGSVDAMCCCRRYFSLDRPTEQSESVAGRLGANWIDTVGRREPGIATLVVPGPDAWRVCFVAVDRWVQDLVVRPSDDHVPVSVPH